MNLLSKRVISTALAVLLTASTAFAASAATIDAKELKRDISYTGLAAQGFSDSDAIRGGIKLSVNDILLNGKQTTEEFSFSAGDTVTLNVAVPKKGNWRIA